MGFGLPHVRKGDLAKAIEVLERAATVGRTSDLQAAGYYAVASFLGAAYALSGRVADALALLEPLAEHSLSMGSVFHHLHIAMSLGEAYLAAGRMEDATALGERTLDLARRHQGQGIEAWALRLLGESEPDKESAKEHYRQALALAAELGMRPLQAHCHLGLGRLNHRSGSAEQAKEHLSTAASMYRDMGMLFWLEKMKAEEKA